MSNKISDLYFSLNANFHDLRVSDFSFARMKNLKIYKGFDRE